MGGGEGEILVLRPRRLKLALYGLFSAMFTAGGGLMILDNDRGGWFVGGFFGVCTLVFVALMLPGAASLMLTREGFRVRSLWRGGFTPWSAVAGFGVGRVGNRDLVAFTVVDPAAKPGARFSRAAAGFDGALPDSYGMSAESLARLMNAWRERALAEPGTARAEP